MSLTSEQKAKWIELVREGNASYEFLRAIYEPSQQDWNRQFLKDKNFNPPLSDDALAELCRNSSRLSTQMALAGDKVTFSEVAENVIDWNEVENIMLLENHRGRLHPAIEAENLCSFWTPFFAVLPRFLMPAIPVALVGFAGFYGAFYCGGFACVIGWLALVLSLLVELFLVLAFIVGCRQMQKATRSALCALDSPEVAAVTRETLARCEAENKTKIL